MREAGITNANLHSGNTLPYLQDSAEFFDFIFSNFVMKHVEHLGSFCQAMYLALKPGGKSLHIVPNTHDTMCQLLIQNLQPAEKNASLVMAGDLYEKETGQKRRLREMGRGWIAPVTHSEFIHDYRDQFEVNSLERYLWPLMDAGFRIRDIKPTREHA